MLYASVSISQEIFTKPLRDIAVIWNQHQNWKICSILCCWLNAAPVCVFHKKSYPRNIHENSPPRYFHQNWQMSSMQIVGQRLPFLLLVQCIAMPLELCLCVFTRKNIHKTSPTRYFPCIKQRKLETTKTELSGWMSEWWIISCWQITRGWPL